MKKYLFILAALGMQMAAFAQSDRYAGAMKANLQQFDSAKSVADFTKLANNFERIGNAEKNQWLPYYYAGLALSLSGWLPEVTDKDANAARINAFCDKAESLTTSNVDKAELQALRNMAATQQMLVDPQNRWATNGLEAGQAVDKGLKLDPNNPRLYYLKGMGVFGTPEQFGGGKSKAKPLFEKAAELYKNQKTAAFYPDWGKKQNEEMIAQCQ